MPKFKQNLPGLSLKALQSDIAAVRRAAGMASAETDAGELQQRHPSIPRKVGRDKSPQIKPPAINQSNL